MKRIIKYTAALISAALLLMLLCTAASAEFDTDKLYDSVTGEAREYLDDNNITPESGVSGLSVSSVLDDIAGYIVNSINAPAEMFASLLAVVILTSLMKNLCEIQNGSIRIYSLISALAAAAVVSSYTGRVITEAGAAAESAGNFMLTYIPVIAGVVAVGGHASAAAAFSSSAVIGTEILAQITRIALIPLTGCMLGISAVSGLKSGLNLGTLSDGIRKAAVWILGLIMTLFLGLLSIQTTLSASADSVALRTARFFVSSGVPIVGGAVSDALSTVSGSLGLIKTGIGGFGIAAGAAMLLPAAISIVCHGFFLFLAAMLAEMFGCDELSAMIKAGQNAVSLSFAVTICFMLFMNISTSMLIASCS